MSFLSYAITLENVFGRNSIKVWKVGRKNSSVTSYGSWAAR